jgi:hypothetical protein
VSHQVSRAQEQLRDSQREDDRDHSDDEFKETQRFSRSLCGPTAGSRITTSEALAVGFFRSFCAIQFEYSRTAAFGRKEA